jgi:hypothetical protein
LKLKHIKWEILFLEDGLKNSKKIRKKWYNISMQNILITGGFGFIGFNAV